VVRKVRVSGEFVVACVDGAFGEGGAAESDWAGKKFQAKHRNVSNVKLRERAT
jgi:hypothetical protein